MYRQMGSQEASPQTVYALLAQETGPPVSQVRLHPPWGHSREQLPWQSTLQPPTLRQETWLPGPTSAVQSLVLEQSTSQLSSQMVSQVPVRLQSTKQLSRQSAVQEVMSLQLMVQSWSQRPLHSSALAQSMVQPTTSPQLTLHTG
jgi:hypothetical protein